MHRCHQSFKDSDRVSRFSLKAYKKRLECEGRGRSLEVQCREGGISKVAVVTEANYQHHNYYQC